jgi:hypothetical protein
MSVHGIQPQFKDYAGYQAWRSDWRELYAHASSEVRSSKFQIKALERKFNDYKDHLDPMLDPVRDRISKLRTEHVHKRAIARKLMTALETAKIRWNQIKSMRNGIKEQAKEFPLEMETKNIDFHFNKKSMEFDFIPMWVVKARGKTFYVNHMECQTGFTTRETPDHPSTKGSLRVKRGTLRISEDGNATIS